MRGLIVGSTWCRGWLLLIDATDGEMVVKRLLSGFGTRCLKLFEVCHLILNGTPEYYLDERCVWAVEALSMNLAVLPLMTIPFFSILVIAPSNQVM
jgi:hypothetical protein